MFVSLLGSLLTFSAFSQAYQIPLTAKGASPLTSDFDKLVAQTLARWHTPGISIAVVDGDKTFSKVYLLIKHLVNRLAELSRATALQPFPTRRSHLQPSSILAPPPNLSQQQPSPS